ncbi:MULTISPECIES: YitT family protein [unclassified Pasteurella]|uniref:membrane protein YczE n=1 Tax=unclassified Pasteurella TaxID=2621516 RepID=UPI0010735B43|nr:YitT family protein [Pasteurella sp. 19428wF3_WM03]TFU53137.1 YitT family protein [Pasteurella sp. WM03]
MKKSRVLPYPRWAASSLWSANFSTLLVLILSLATLGIGDGLIVLSGLGSTPWTVLSQGVALQTQISIGWSSFFISCIVMLAWLPLKLRFGLGTILNMIVIAFFLGLTTKILPPPTALSGRIAFGLAGISLYGLGTAFYLSCHLGAGPRDGLMVGLCQRFQLNVGIVRTTLEVSVCLLGFILGGTVGIGTLIFATGIGWIVQGYLRLISHLPHSLNERNDLR